MSFDQLKYRASVALETEFPAPAYDVNPDPEKTRGETLYNLIRDMRKNKIYPDANTIANFAGTLE